MPSPTPIDLDGYFHALGRIHAWERARGGPDSPVYKERGYCYGPFRTVTDHFVTRSGFRVLLTLRDPRDVLVSLHHNYTKS